MGEECPYSHNSDDLSLPLIQTVEAPPPPEEPEKKEFQVDLQSCKAAVSPIKG